MEIWSKCDICGRDIPVGELCYGLKKGNCICKNCCTGFENCTFTLAPAPTLTPPNEWVSVDKKLPKCGVPVLIGNPHWDYPVVASCAGYGVWMDSWHQKMTFTPTYWMPLPAAPDRRPPEGEEDNHG